MRGNPDFHDFVTFPSLQEVLSHLTEAPGEWLPMAGGTEIMVAYAAGRLTSKKLINLWGLAELMGIQTRRESISIGAGVTFGQLRADPAITSYFPLLSRAASWIGSIANQNRATLGGNIVNGSPAADAPPALLVYDAQIELISIRGRRTLPYREFHTGYKTSILNPDELVYAVHLPLRYSNHYLYLRKVGTRRAMAITKVGLAGTALLNDGRMTDVRLSGVSLADRPVRLTETEAALEGRELTFETRQAAVATLLSEVRPIDDIRSNARYRSQVAANLLVEFINALGSAGVQG